MYKRFTSMILILTVFISGIFSGCNVEEESFPDLDLRFDVSESETAEQEDIITDHSDFHELTVALPVSDETAGLLMKLFYAKNNDLFPSDMTGADISIEYLNAINTPWVINSIYTASTGETEDTLNELTGSGIFPDVFLTGDMNELIDSDMVISLDNYLSGDQISSYSVYMNELEALEHSGSHYGLPFYSTVYILAGNRDFVPESGIPSYVMSPEELIDYIEQIPSYAEDGTYITVFYDALSLSPFLGEDFSSALINEGLSSVSDNYGADPRVSRTCGMWLMESYEFDTWNYYYPEGLYFTMLPTERVQSVVYPICVSSTCSDPEFAASFASFVCFDPDAQMLLRRLEPLRGFMPPVSTGGVWDEMASDEYFGTQSMLYEQYMANAVYNVAENS